VREGIDPGISGQGGQATGGEWAGRLGAEPAARAGLVEGAGAVWAASRAGLVARWGKATRGSSAWVRGHTAALASRRALRGRGQPWPGGELAEGQGRAGAAPATGCRDAGPALVAACARRGTRIGGGGAGRLRQTVVRAPWPSANREQRGGREERERTHLKTAVQVRLLLRDLDLERETRSYATVGWVYRRERRRWLPISSSIASRPSERGSCEHDQGKHEQHNVCEEIHSNDPVKRTRDLELARREEEIYVYLYIYYRVFEILNLGI
jgi:hypothetical protein